MALTVSYAINESGSEGIEVEKIIKHELLVNAQNL